jgi:hypothetical protein
MTRPQPHNLRAYSQVLSNAQSWHVAMHVSNKICLRPPIWQEQENPLSGLCDSIAHIILEPKNHWPDTQDI